MTPEDRLAQLMRSDAEGYEPQPDGLDQIHRRARRRRRVQIARLIGAPILFAAIVASIAVPLLTGGAPSPQQVISTGPGRAGAEDLVVARPGGQLQIFAPGPLPGPFVVRTLAVDTGDADITWLSASPDGTSAYANITPRRTPACYLPGITRIDLSNGSTKVIGIGALPTVDPSGHELAYLQRANGCSTPPLLQIGIRDLRTGATAHLSVPPHVGGVTVESVGSISWSPDGRHLLLTVSGPEGHTALLVDTKSPSGTLGKSTWSSVMTGAVTATYTDTGSLALVTAGSCPPSNFCVSSPPAELTFYSPETITSAAGSTPSKSPSAPETLLTTSADELVSARHGGGLAYIADRVIYVRWSSQWQLLAAGVTAASWATISPQGASEATTAPPASSATTSGASPGPGTPTATWTRLDSGGTPLPQGAQINSVVEYRAHLLGAGPYFPTGGSSEVPGCSYCEPVVWSSADASRWTPVWDTGGVTLGSGTRQLLVVMGSQVLLFDSGTGGTALWASTDGRTWHRVKLPSEMEALTAAGAAYSHGRVVVIFSNKFAGGPVTAYGQGDQIWTSTNGTSWTQDPISGTVRFDSITATGRGFLVGGETNQSQAMTWLSTDGLTWTANSPGSAAGPVYVAANSSVMVLYAGSSTSSQALWSSDGRAWYPASVHGGAINGASYNAVLLSTAHGFIEWNRSGGVMWWSSDGTSWRLIRSAGGPTSPVTGVYIDSSGVLVEAQGSFWQVTFSQ